MRPGETFVQYRERRLKERREATADRREHEDAAGQRIADDLARATELLGYSVKR